MAETLNFIFQNFWTYFGTIFLMLTCGYALSFPFYWYNKIQENKDKQKTWNHLN